MITEDTVYSDEVTIDAPIDLVWDILLDFENYGAWNGFCPEIKVASLEPGSAVEMMVDMGAGPNRLVEYISSVEPPNSIVWAAENKPGDPITAVRSQKLTAVSDTQCTYISIDEFGGPGREAMMKQAAAAVEAGFNRCAYDLKAHAEKTFLEQSA